MKPRIEKINNLFRKKQSTEITIKKKIKSSKSDNKLAEIEKLNKLQEEFETKYDVIKGNFMSYLDYLHDLDNQIVLKNKEFNSYKLNVLYDFEEMKTETYDKLEKELEKLKQDRTKIIIKHKKKINEKKELIDKLNMEINDRLLELKDINKEEKKINYKEIMERKKAIFDIKQTDMSIIPVIFNKELFSNESTKPLSTLIIDYNPIKEYEIDLNSLQIQLGNNINLKDLEELE